MYTTEKFDPATFTPARFESDGEIELREGPAPITGRLCVIGSKLNEAALAELFPAR